MPLQAAETTWEFREKAPQQCFCYDDEQIQTVIKLVNDLSDGSGYDTYVNLTIKTQQEHI